MKVIEDSWLLFGVYLIVAAAKHYKVVGEDCWAVLVSGGGAYAVRIYLFGGQFTDCFGGELSVFDDFFVGFLVKFDVVEVVASEILFIDASKKEEARVLKSSIPVNFSK